MGADPDECLIVACDGLAPGGRKAELSEVTRAAAETIARIVAGQAIEGAVLAQIDCEIGVEPILAFVGTGVIVQQEETTEARKAKTWILAVLAASRTFGTCDLFALEVSPHGRTSRSGYYQRSEVADNVAGEAVALLVAGVAVVRAFRAGPKQGVGEVPGLAVVVAVGVRPHEVPHRTEETSVIGIARSTVQRTLIDDPRSCFSQETARRSLQHFIKTIHRHASLSRRRHLPEVNCFTAREASSTCIARQAVVGARLADTRFGTGIISLGATRIAEHAVEKIILQASRALC